MRADASRLWRYSAAIGAVGAAFLLKLALVPMLTQETPFLLFFGAVLVAAWTGGLGPGLLATAMACLLNDYFFMAPLYRLELADRVLWLKLALFAGEGLFISVLASRMKSAKRRAEENAQRASDLESRVVQISEQEQQRIGRELHDGLGQHLTGIALLSRHLAQRLQAKAIPEAADADKIERLVNDAVRQTRDIASGLSSFAIEVEGLASALQDLAEQTQDLFHVSCSFAGTALPPGSYSIEASHLYRIAQEAVHNAAKHSHASHIDLNLAMRGDQVIMVIQDNGTGLPTGEARSGMGLQTMTERAGLIGASLDIRPVPGGGTVVTCIWPCVPRQTDKE